MFNTLSYCFGFASRELNSSKEVESPTFKTEEVEDQWTLVEINDSNSDKGGYLFLTSTAERSIGRYLASQ